VGRAGGAARAGGTTDPRRGRNIRMEMTRRSMHDLITRAAS